MLRFQLGVFAICLLCPLIARGQTDTNRITRDMVVDAQKLIGLNFSDGKIDMMLPGLKEQLETFETLHRFPLSNSVPPALLFNPIPVGMKFEHERKKFKATAPRHVKLPANL